MYPTSRNLFLILLLLFIALMPVLSGNLGLIDEDDDPEDDGLLELYGFPVTWTRMRVYQVSALFRFGLSIFALYLVYSGGRSKNKRFNDRTIDPINSLIGVFSKAALLRAAFNFLVIGPNPDSTNIQLFELFVYPQFYLEGGSKS